MSPESTGLAAFQARHRGAARHLRNAARYVGSNLLFTPAARMLFSIRNRHVRDIAYHAIKGQAGIRYFCLDTSDESLILNCRDDVISRELFRSGHFDFDKFEKAVALLRRHGALTGAIDCLYDIGANIGTIALPAVTRGHASSAVAVEPHPINSRILRANVALNGLEDVVMVVEAAAGDQPGGFVELEINERNWGDHRVAPRDSSAGGAQGESARPRISVPLKSVDQIAAETGRPPSLLWMDTQGYEGFVLAGARGVIEAGVPIVTELWPYSLKRTGCYDAFIAAVLRYSTFIDLTGNGEAIPTARLTDHYARLGVSEGADIILLP